MLLIYSLETAMIRADELKIGLPSVFQPLAVVLFDITHHHGL
jgi:hypothetical protein